MTATQVIRRSRKIREEAAIRDKTYQDSPVGQQVKRWLESLRWQDMSQHTLDSYEIVGALLARDHHWFNGLHDFCGRGGEGVGLIRSFLDDHWRDCAPATRKARQSGLKNLFAWAVDEGICEWNPVEKIRTPKRRQPNRMAHPETLILDLVFAQESLRDRICLQLLGRLGLRKDELRLLQVRDVNLVTNQIRVRGKGGKTRLLPLASMRSVREELHFHLLVESLRQTDFLLYPKRNPAVPMSRAGVHLWFKRCLERADLPDFPMHEMRHSAADHLYRSTGNLYAVSQLLGHEHVGTTEVYLHPSLDDLDRQLAVVEAGWAEAARGRAPGELSSYGGE